MLSSHDIASLAQWMGGSHRDEEEREERPAPAGRHMNAKQCAAYIGRTTQAVYHLVHRHQIPFNQVGRKPQFDKEEVDRWMRKHAKRGAMVR